MTELKKWKKIRRITVLSSTLISIVLMIMMCFARTNHGRGAGTILLLLGILAVALSVALLFFRYRIGYAQFRYVHPYSDMTFFQYWVKESDRWDMEQRKQKAHRAAVKAERFHDNIQQGGYFYAGTDNQGNRIYQKAMASGGVHEVVYDPSRNTAQSDVY